MSEWDEMVARQVAADGVRTTWGEHMPADDARPRFDEHRLRADIVKVWGEYGAHVDLFDHIVKRQREGPATAQTQLTKSPSPAGSPREANPEPEPLGVMCAWSWEADGAEHRVHDCVLPEGHAWPHRCVCSARDPEPVTEDRPCPDCEGEGAPSTTTGTVGKVSPASSGGGTGKIPEGSTS